jgi:tRNA (cytidine32/uridine32-2'-O)-methyltransferase
VSRIQKDQTTPADGMLQMPITRATAFVFVRPHYPENVGALARAMKVMGLTRLALVKPSRIATPEHEMAQRMAVKSLDVLNGASLHPDLASALADNELAFCTTARRGVSGVLQPREAAREAARAVRDGQRVAFVFGNEKTGLSEDDRALCRWSVRIPIAADQPSLNVAQAAQIIAYELFMAGLEERALTRESGARGPAELG